MAHGHSPLGASGAYRWLACSGSARVALPSGEGKVSEYAALGTAAHTLAAHCLTTNTDAWEHIDGAAVDKDMADAVQVYLDINRLGAAPDKVWIEHRFHCPSIHPLFFGTVDFAKLYADRKLLIVRDYKHGAGIVVGVENNPQLMYYAAGLLSSNSLWGRVNEVVLEIVQPRAGLNNPVSSWQITTDELLAWVDLTLVPGMNHATISDEMVSGEHCRFCPVRELACPRLVSDLKELEELMETLSKIEVAKWSNDQIGKALDLFDKAKIMAKVWGEQAFVRLSAGGDIPGRKLAEGKSNREWKAEAEAFIVAKFGDEAYTLSLKSPAQIEKLPLGTDTTTEWAFKPKAGLVVVPAGDVRQGVNQKVKSMFQPINRGA